MPSLSEILIALALIVGCGVALLSALGMAIAVDVHDRLHVLGPTGVSAALIAAALWFDSGPSLLALKGSLTAAVVVAGGPLLAHVISRAARIQARGDWRWTREDGGVEER
jgi:multisubunit Na+/H+ antiporter MnhG subunit